MRFSIVQAIIISISFLFAGNINAEKDQKGDKATDEATATKEAAAKKEATKEKAATDQGKKEAASENENDSDEDEEDNSVEGNDGKVKPANLVGPFSNCTYTYDPGEIAEGETDRPNHLVRSTITNLFCAIEAEGEGVSEAKIKELVEQIVIPSVGTQIMSKWVLGRNWRKLTKTQKIEFISLFKDLMVRTYAGSITKYVGFKVNYYPYKHDDKAKKATVKLAIERKDGPEIPLAFKLRKMKGGKWKVYDALVDGISLVANYRTTFGSIVKKKGISALLEKLREESDIK